ncbi:hypothetical protein CXP39_02750 [Mesoplasma syrphidae]|uniref:Uncharacterized protein n=1 Tax=Mesoplasma syrphidae TaxID=225999 RepID=A0A2K9CDH7_9MOLU|nr:hypothetical protein [Mesoplasma syrphidae]AUF83704.1 hypothetical protein CXP39_02750 [Mesoplasma syrphidae]
MQKKDSIKKYRESQKQVHNQEVNEIIKETYSSSNQNAKLYYYKINKKLRWWGWLLPLLLTSLSTGLSFLIGWSLYWNFNLNGASGGWAGVGWVAFSILIGFAFSYMILSWIRNRRAAEFFNHKGRRYQLTLTDWEAKIIMWKKIIGLTTVLMVIVTGLTIGLL